MMKGWDEARRREFRRFCAERTTECAHPQPMSFVMNDGCSCLCRLCFDLTTERCICPWCGDCPDQAEG